MMRAKREAAKQLRLKCIEVVLSLPKKELKKEEAD